MSVDIFVTAHRRHIPRYEATNANYIINLTILVFISALYDECHTVYLRFEILGLLLAFCTWKAHSMSTINIVNLEQNSVRVEFKISWTHGLTFVAFLFHYLAISLLRLAGARRANGWHDCHSVHERNCDWQCAAAQSWLQFSCCMCSLQLRD